MTHDEILTLLYEETLVGNAPAVADGVKQGLACLMTIGRSSATRRGDSRSVGPETLSAATTRASWSNTGAAIALSPSSSSSAAVAKPSERTVASSASSARRSATVREVSASSGPAGDSATP